jgi:hypothetical protein
VSDLLLGVEVDSTLPEWGGVSIDERRCFLMPEKKQNSQEAVEPNQKEIELRKERVPSTVLSGAEKLLDGDIHTGIAVQVTSDDKLSTLMIPDVGEVKNGAPVYITNPVRINGENLSDFLKEKGIDLGEKVNKFIGKTKISCEAFYYSKDGPLLMVFALTFKDENDKGGLISNLTGESSLGKLFDIQGASVRVLRCPKTSFAVLEKYAAELSE